MANLRKKKNEGESEREQNGNRVNWLGECRKFEVVESSRG
jgi:hypothetical protein